MAKGFRAPAAAKVLSRAANLSVASQAGEMLLRVPVTQIRTNPQQSRTIFDEAKLEELAASIQTQGIVEPLVGREEADGSYTLIAGERRLRAALKLGLADVPLVLRQVADNELFELGLIENIQRENLHPVDEARSCALLVERSGGQKEAAARLGMKRSSLANIVRALELGDEILSLCSQVPDLPRRFLRKLLEMPVSLRAKAVRALLATASGDETGNSTVAAALAPSKERTNKFRFAGKVAAKFQFSLQVNFRKKDPTENEFEAALIATLAAKAQENRPELQALSAEEIQRAITATLAGLPSSK
ncbi:MAG: ParB/RepB/Spo0J family partition protein [Blastocatellia bacterium]|nr:ParB/RepB/Spo0J family partition protein [Blastocatellia bacterium]